jgi:L-ribulose-5-phosphate 3-epimerase
MQIHGHDIGVCSWSLRPDGLGDLVKRVHALGLTHVQLALAHLADLDKAACDQYVAEVKASGLTVTATMISFKQEDYSTIASIRRTGGYVAGVNWNERRTDTIEAAKVTRALGVSMISTHVGFVPMSSDPQYKAMVDRVGEIAGELDKVGVTFLMETGQEPASEMLQFLNDLRVRNVGVNFDPANMILYGAGDPVEAIRILGRHIRHVHVKDAISSGQPGTQWGEEVPFGSGDVNATGFLAALHEVGYSGPLVIEREAGAQRDADVKTAVATLKAISL